MKLQLTASEQDFTQEVRAFLAQHWDGGATLIPGPRRWAAERRYLRALADRGWLAGQWPKSLGGAAWSDAQRLLWEREAAAVCAPQVSPHGVDLLGPLLREVGTTVQRDRHLPGIASGQVNWCQAFAEDSGALDIARVACKALPSRSPAARPDELAGWTLSGVKPWVLDLSSAALAQNTPGARQGAADNGVADNGALKNWLYVLALTPETAGGQQPEPETANLSLFLVDAQASGVRIKPRAMVGEPLGAHAVHSVFFDEVRLPAGALLGTPGQGAAYAREIERRSFQLPGSVARSSVLLNQLRRYLEEEAEQFSDRAAPLSAAARSGAAGSLWADDAFRARLHQLEVELTALQALESRAWLGASAQRSGDQEAWRLGLASRLEPLNSQIVDLQIEALGYFALPFVDFSALDNEGAIGPEFAQPALLGMLSHRARAVIGAPREHLKNIIAKSVLNLPDGTHSKRQ